jgi:hypothetical protein
VATPNSVLGIDIGAFADHEIGGPAGFALLWLFPAELPPPQPDNRRMKQNAFKIIAKTNCDLIEQELLNLYVSNINL